MEKPYVEPVFELGKYKGEKVRDVIEKDLIYVLWLKKNIKEFVLPADLEELLNEYEKALTK